MVFSRWNREVQSQIRTISPRNYALCPVEYEEYCVSLIVNPNRKSVFGEALSSCVSILKTFALKTTRHWVFFLGNNTRQRIAEITQEKIMVQNMGYLPYSKWFADLYPREYHFSFQEDQFISCEYITNNTISNASKPDAFYTQGINNLLNNWDYK